MDSFRRLIALVAVVVLGSWANTAHAVNCHQTHATMATAQYYCDVNGAAPWIDLGEGSCFHVGLGIQVQACGYKSPYNGTEYWEGSAEEFSSECSVPANTVIASGPMTTGMAGDTFCGVNSNCIFEMKATHTAASCFQGTAGIQCYANVEVTSTGETCPEEATEEDEDDYTPPEEICVATGGGYSQCKEDDNICVKTPSGTKFCWAIDGDKTPPCKETGVEAACHSPNRPEEDEDDDWDPNGPPAISDHVDNGDTTNININTFINNGPENPDPDDDEDDDEGDDEEEDDEDEDERSAHVGACKGAFSCSGDAIDCLNAEQNWKARCELEGGSMLLNDIKERLTDIKKAITDKGKAALSSDCKIRSQCEGTSPGAALLCAQLLSHEGKSCDLQKALEQKGATEGSADCETEPTCPGDTIHCAFLKSQFRTRCLLGEKLDTVAEAIGGTASGGSNCAAAPVCNGPEVACAALAQAWLTRCDGQASAASEVSEADWGEVSTTDGLFDEASEGEPTPLDTTGYGWGGECYIPPPLSLMGGKFTLEFSSIEWLCEYQEILGALMMIGAALLCATILSRGL